MPLHRRVPKRGFSNYPFRKEYAVVNLDQMAGFKGEVTPESLKASGLVRKLGDGVVLLGRGDAPAGLKVKVHRISKQARQKIEGAGGTVEILSA